MPFSPGEPAFQQRQQWMSILAKAPVDQLVTLSEPFLKDFLDDAEPESSAVKVIRAPEIGLTQVRARMGGTGAQFNVGDVTMTRCVVQINAREYGHSYVLGRDKKHALIAAKLDALLQNQDCYEPIYSKVISPLTQLLKAQQQAKQAASAATKVDFFTLVRGED